MRRNAILFLLIPLMAFVFTACEEEDVEPDDTTSSSNNNNSSSNNYTMDINVLFSDILDSDADECFSEAITFKVNVYNDNLTYDVYQSSTPIPLNESIDYDFTFEGFSLSGSYTIDVFINEVYIKTTTEFVQGVELEESATDDVRITIFKTEVDC